MSTIADLRALLNSYAAGPIEESDPVVSLLQDCWGLFSGSTDQKMRADKLSRIEDLTWRPPILSFIIERHGGTVLGSTRADVQDWSLDLDMATASCRKITHRQLRPMSTPLKVDPLAEKVASKILGGESDPNLKWVSENHVRVLIGRIIPDEGPKETISGRRRRFRKALNTELQTSSWHESSPNTWKKQGH